MPRLGRLRRYAAMTPGIEQELSYRKQIEQYDDGIYDNPVTLKSRLRVTQGNWKRNHWVDHTRLTISRVI